MPIHHQWVLGRAQRLALLEALLPRSHISLGGGRLARARRLPLFSSLYKFSRSLQRSGQDELGQASLVDVCCLL